MKKQKKKFESPLKPWSKERIEKERELLFKYGLRRKHEIWRAESILRNFRQRARILTAKKNKAEEQILIKKLNDLGLISKNAKVEDILALTNENLLDRRLQTIVHKKGLANTLKQARQFIVHGHIAVDGRRMKWPSTIIHAEDENKISFYPKSKLKGWKNATK